MDRVRCCWKWCEPLDVGKVGSRIDVNGVWVWKHVVERLVWYLKNYADLRYPTALEAISLVYV
jgi:hypothetical protein